MRLTPLLLFALLACTASPTPKDTVTDSGDSSADTADSADTVDTVDTSAETGLPADWPTAVDAKALSGILADLADAAMQGRLTGSPSGSIAEDYVRTSLSAAGWTVAEQSVPLPIWDIGTPIELSLIDEKGTATTSFAYIDDYREVLFTGSGRFEAPLVFAGDGSDENLAAIDASGRILAMTMGFWPDQQYVRAHDAGVLGVLLIPTGSSADYDAMYGAIYQPNLFGTGSPVDETALIDDFPGLWIHTGAVEALLGKSVSELEADPTPFDTGFRARMELHGTSLPDATCQNLFAVREGADPELAEETLMVGAHYDHIGRGGDGSVFFGASDNGSGAAVMLELAQRLGAVAEAPRRRVVLALWCGEEQGIYGSYRYVAEPVWPLEKTVLYVNLDNIADPPGPYLIRAGKSSFQDDFLAPSAKDAIREQHLGWQCGSDECPFYEDAGVPILRYMDFGQDGHTLGDTFEDADLDGMTRVADEVLRGIGAVGW